MGNRNDLRMRMQRFLYGRNGMDILGKDVYIFSIILIILNLFVRSGIIGLIALFGLFYSIFRALSRNIASRSAENLKYIALRNKVTGRFRLGKRQWEDRNTYRYYICPSCTQKVRVPKGRGRIEIRCPKCGSTFIKRT